MITETDVRKALESVMDPELHKSLIELGMVRRIRILKGQVDITLALTTLGCPLKDQIVADVKEAVGALEGVETIDIDLAEMTEEEKRRIGIGVPQQEKGAAEDLNEIHRVIAVMSGKGGAGKSLISGLLAVALRREGYRVGILDADITGPSIPKMFFPNGARLATSPMGPMPPQSKDGIKVMSINLLLEQEDMAVIWRGPLVGGAIKQFWGDIFWGTLDYLIVDLPPGTSDASLTVMQSLPLSGIVLVSSPQGLAGMVVRKAARMAQQMQTPMLGLIENMSYFECPDTGKRYEIFGPSHAKETAAQIGIPFLGRLPIDPEIARLCDAGRLEEYLAEDFVLIAQELERRTPKARRSMFLNG
ncbi:MAG TPA: Mrp/NBP35 family ATP-binding protein [Anaerolineae bacterium]|nr:Mrp/NBP35 family ATP-binding protein [Anaerolineae bacterium]